MPIVEDLKTQELSVAVVEPSSSPSSSSWYKLVSECCDFFFSEILGLLFHLRKSHIWFLLYLVGLTLTESELVDSDVVVLTRWFWFREWLGQGRASRRPKNGDLISRKALAEFESWPFLLYILLLLSTFWSLSFFFFFCDDYESFIVIFWV